MKKGTKHIQRLLPLFACFYVVWFCGYTACSPSPSQRTEAGTQETHQPSPEHTPPKQTVGRTCEVNTQCQAPQYCETRIPGGYCTKPCQKSVDCPAQSACARIAFATGESFLRCALTCQDNKDCRSGFFCYHPAKAWKQICIPSER